MDERIQLRRDLCSDGRIRGDGFDIRRSERSTGCVRQDRDDFTREHPFWTEVGAMALFGAVLGVLVGLPLALFVDSLTPFGPDGVGLSAGDRFVHYPTFVISGGSLGAIGMGALGAVLIGIGEGIVWLWHAWIGRKRTKSRLCSPPG
ncbi:hypothetical protein AYO44_14900 [Planctomycetaceae bacterium SCGC AG-212-F19]|nr:hypothetical protein AYO44_14900 [Planctomycetaceae bacterium SCGC AG-212-F19]